LQVGLRDHLRVRVHVARRRRQRDAGHAQPGALNGPRVRAAEREYLKLMVYAALLGQLQDLVQQPAGGYRAAVHDLDADPAAQLGHPLVVLDVGRVYGQRGVEGDADVGLDAVRARKGAAQSDLLLGGEDGVDLEGRVLEALERLDGDPATGAVVERLAGDDLA